MRDTVNTLTTGKSRGVLGVDQMDGVHEELQKVTPSLLRAADRLYDCLGDVLAEAKEKLTPGLAHQIIARMRRYDEEVEEACNVV